HRLDALSEIIVIDVSTRALRVVATDPTARIVTPAWRPDGRAIVAAADFNADTFNLYEFDAESGSVIRQLTRVSGGALWPDISLKGDLITFAGYTVDGFDVFTMPYPTSVPVVRTFRSASAASLKARTTSVPEGGHYLPKTYSPWATLPPTSWSPIVESG